MLFPKTNCNTQISSACRIKLTSPINAQDVGKLGHSERTHHSSSPAAVLMDNPLNGWDWGSLVGSDEGVLCILNFSLALVFACSSWPNDVKQNSAKHHSPNSCVPRIFHSCVLVREKTAWRCTFFPQYNAWFRNVILEAVSWNKS